MNRNKTQITLINDTIKEGIPRISESGKTTNKDIYTSSLSKDIIRMKR